jgi:predicted RNase H-like HicB family nuclease
MARTVADLRAATMCGVLNGASRGKRVLTAVIEREGSLFVSLCLELDIASQGASVEEARANLAEALELLFETASPEEISRRTSGAV